MASVSVQLENPGTRLEVEVSDEMVMSLFTDVAAAKMGIFGINKRIDTLWRTLLAFATVNVGLLGSIIGFAVSRG